MNSNFSELRREYSYTSLDEAELDPDPIRQFSVWFQKAVEAELELPNAMALATASKSGAPTVRFVLLKGFDASGFVFYSHADSVKGRQIAENPRAALVFYWAPMHRQVRIDGRVEHVSDREADEYFQSRPYDSRVSAWVARQSSIVASRDFLEREFYKVAQEFPGEEIPRPQDWVGYKVVPAKIEFWQGREGRLHDRIEYVKTDAGSWSMRRLAP
jgi:pyridoxamine 5'-phosphate oxidase